MTKNKSIKRKTIVALILISVIVAVLIASLVFVLAKELVGVRTDIKVVYDDLPLEVKSETWDYGTPADTTDDVTYYYVEMGEYPQTLYKYSDTVPSELTATSDTINIDLSGTYGYTRSSEGSYTTTKGYGSATNAFTIYTDTSGNRYIWHKVYASDTDTSSTHNLYMDGTTHTTDGLAFFKLEPIKWDVLGYYADDTKAIFVKVTDSNFDATHTENIVVKSRDALQGMSWNTTANSDVDYNASTIQGWLRNFENNFLAEYKDENIEKVTNDVIDSSANTSWSAITGGNPTLSSVKVEEYAWLMDYNQAVNIFDNDASRLASPSDFALATYAYQYKNTNDITITKPNGGTSFWWLRSSYNSDGGYYAGFVTYTGFIYYGSLGNYSYAVAPALLINL